MKRTIKKIIIFLQKSLKFWGVGKINNFEISNFSQDVYQ